MPRKTLWPSIFTRVLGNALGSLPTCLGRFCLRAISLSLCSVGLLLFAPLLETLAPKHGSVVPKPAEKPVSGPSPLSRLGIKLKSGDTLLALLTRHGMTRLSAHELIAKVRPLVNLRKLKAGNQVDLVVHHGDRSVQGMEVKLEDNIVRAKATAQGWDVEQHTIPSVMATRVVRGQISSSLYDDGIAAGLTAEHILELAQIFEYDIDFFSDFRTHDHFAVVVEELHYADGRRAPRRILAAELETDGESNDAYYFAAGNGAGSYYDADGKQLRRWFLRAPLSYSRISSFFSAARRHPIFRIVRPHKAIDYAAPSGTPVVAIGPGKVTFSGWQLGYGNLVEIAHPGGYASRYGHFSRIAPGIRRGVNVDGGEVIGFVGQTGHATGPHLHFEFLQRGQKINFLNLKIPRIEQLAGNDLNRFKIERDHAMARLQNQNPATSRAARDL